MLGKIFQAAHFGNERKTNECKEMVLCVYKYCCMFALLVPPIQKNCADVEGSHIQKKMTMIVGQRFSSEDSHGGQSMHMFCRV